MFNAFISGMILAFGLILPLGIQNVFLFNQGVSQKHFINALPSVITAGLCDTMLIILSVMGVSTAVLSFPWLKNMLLSIGIVFLTRIGWSIWHTQEKKPTHQSVPHSAKNQILLSASASLLNPHAMIDTIGVIGTNALHFQGNAKFAYTLACITTSFIWFFLLTMIGFYFKKTDSTGRMMKIMNQLSSIILFGTAFYFAWQLLQNLQPFKTLH